MRSHLFAFLMLSGTPAPALASFDFDLADPAGGDVVTVTGTNLTGAVSCTVGGVAASLGANTPTTLAFTIPAVNLAALPSFDGTNDELDLPGATQGDYQSATAYGGWALVYPDDITAAGGSFYDGHSILGTDTNAYWLLYLRVVAGTSYVGIRHYQSASGIAVHVEAPISKRAWTLVQWSYDGATVKIRANGGAWFSDGATAQQIIQPLKMGVTAYSVAFKGKIAEMALVAANISDGNHDDVIAAINNDYRMGLGGVPASGFDRATLSLAGFWKAGNYASGTWTATASAGASGGRNATEATNPPSVSTPPWWGTHSVVVTTGSGSSNGLPIELWDPTADPNTTLLFDSVSVPYNSGTGVWTPRYSLIASLDLDVTVGGTAPAVSGGGPSFDGNGAGEGSLIGDGAASPNGAWRDFLGPVVVDSQSGTVAAVYKSTTATAFNAALPFQTGQAFANMNQGTIGVAFASVGGTPSITGHTYHLDLGGTLDLSVSGALSGGNYASVPLTGAAGYKAATISATADVLRAVAIRFDKTSNSYTNVRLSMGSAYSDTAQPGSQTFAGNVRAACVQKAKCSDTFITKHYKWARVRFLAAA